MIILSDQFSRISKAVLTLSFTCIAIKFLPVETVSAGPIKIDAANKDIIAGAVGLVLMLSTVTCIIFLLRDYYLTRISDDISDDELGDIEELDFLKTPPEQVDRLQGLASRYEALSWLGFVAVGLTPTILGTITTILIWRDMINFMQNIIIKV